MGLPVTTFLTVHVRGRAYCGAAHHLSFQLPAGSPPSTVDLPVPDGVQRYHLVLSPQTGRPACDREGNILYVPAPEVRVRACAF